MDGDKDVLSAASRELIEGELEDRMREYEKLDGKGPRRSYARKEYGDIVMYTLPNGIAIFNSPKKLEEGRRYSKEFDSFQDSFLVVENFNEWTIIKLL